MTRLYLALSLALGSMFGSGSAPTSSASVPPRGVLLVVTKEAHALALVDSTSLKVVARVPVGEDPHEVVVAADGRSAYVSNYGEGTLHTLQHVDLDHARALASIDLTPLQGAHGLAVHGGQVWLTAEGSKALGVLDGVTGRLTAVLGTGQNKTHLVWVSRDGERVLASNAGSGTFSIFDRVVNHPTTVAGAPPLPAAYTAPTWKQTLVPVGEAAEGFAVSPDELEAWVGNADGSVSIIDLAAHRVVATAQSGAPGSNRLAFTPDGRRLIMTTHTGKDLIVFSTASQAVVARIPIEERGASGIQIEPGGRRAFVSCPRDHFVAVVDLGTLKRVATIDAGREPDGLAWWTRP